MSPFYKIRIATQLDPRWSEWLDNLEIIPLETGETLLSGLLRDQSSLYGVLNRLRDMKLEILYLEKDSARD